MMPDTPDHPHISSEPQQLDRGTRRRVLKLLSLAAGAAVLAPTVLQSVSKVRAADATGKRTILITGSTSGMGRRLAERLAGPGTTVLVHGRNRGRGEEAVKAVRDAGGEARFYGADFASLAEVRRLAEAVAKDNDRLEVLINNAGIFNGEPGNGRQLSKDGHELRFAINYLAPFVLTQQLLPLVKAGRPARIVNIASSGQNPIDFNDVMLARGYSDQRAYGQSKLALIMYTLDLANELKGSGVTANAIHPANYMDTPMVRDAGIRPWTSVDEGANAVLRLIEAKELAETTGRYFSGQSESRASSQAYDERARARLKALSLQLASA
ncbi:SDR family NAD(P)-dependent oxidoreductase [Rhodopseudomonas infernalis]|uniref:SDR family NAD(P)-dependent oxidoreductase n=1 Tax=Rhodopseudomonas infernalis TaxID=2897386 RepID=UPI0021F069D9|nr:SDR family NAD(P)-dependent oxidoreductase [Rhodopseudomonas infernalis]